MKPAPADPVRGPPSGPRAIASGVIAGVIASIVLMANVVSFAALMFGGPLSAGTPTAVWAMLVGSGITGIWVAWKTSLPPMATGIDSPTGAVLVLLATSVGGGVLAAGGSAETAVQTALLLFSGATVVCGVLLLGLGLARRGATLRFVPYFVVAGFLAATGVLLVAGGVRMATGHGGAALLAHWSGAELARLVCALGALAVLLVLRRAVRSSLALPVALLVMITSASVALRLLGLSDPQHGWYPPSWGALQAWQPLVALRSTQLPWPATLAFLPELLAVAIVALVSLVTKTSSLEVARKSSGDLDQELRAHGAATLAVAPLGGIVASMQLGSSRLLEQAGGASRWSGVAAAAVMLLVGLTNLDLPSLIPLPIAAGLVFYLGYGFIVEALSKPFAQRDWLNLGLALAITFACVRWGYLVGVLGGVVAACLLFAASYARVGVVRQHLSRAQFAGNVSRSNEATRYLVDHGDAIQIYWLSGYIFFGSSEGVFERVRHDLRARAPGAVRHVVLDFGMVSGADASATVSLAKLRNACQPLGVTLLFSALTPALRGPLEREGFFSGRGRPPPFADANTALAWCEDAVLAEGGVDGGSGFPAWLQQQLGGAVAVDDFMAFLDRRDVQAGQVLYREGEPSDDIDLVASGRLAVEISRGNGQTLRVRSISTHTVIGEMGFFRHAPRSATVLAEEAATVYTLSRASFERMRAQRPELASAFDDFLLRTLADRIGLADRMVVALSR